MEFLLQILYLKRYNDNKITKATPETIVQLLKYFGSLTEILHLNKLDLWQRFGT